MVGNNWDIVLKNVWESENFKKFYSIIKKEYQTKTIYPEEKNIFNSLKFTSYDKVKVVIVGQDPYHQKGQAHGLAFSVQRGVKIPPSLVNIFKERKDDLGIPPSAHGDLTKWAKEGVLLLNSVLTVEEGKAGSHENIGWKLLTDHIIKILNKKDTPIVFILWGNYAKNKKGLITNPNHFIIESGHPSPFSANLFLRTRPFSKANEFLKSKGIKEINWES